MAITNTELEYECSHLLKVLDLVSPGKPELRPAVHKEQEGLVGVPRFHIVQPHPIHTHVLVLSVPGDHCSVVIVTYCVLELLALSRHRSSFLLCSKLFWLVPLIAKC